MLKSTSFATNRYAGMSYVSQLTKSPDSRSLIFSGGHLTLHLTMSVHTPVHPLDRASIHPLLRPSFLPSMRFSQSRWLLRILFDWSFPGAKMDSKQIQTKDTTITRRITSFHEQMSEINRLKTCKHVRRKYKINVNRMLKWKLWRSTGRSITWLLLR